MLMKQAAEHLAPLTGLDEEEVLRLLEIPTTGAWGCSIPLFCTRQITEESTCCDCCGDCRRTEDSRLYSCSSRALCEYPV